MRLSPPAWLALCAGLLLAVPATASSVSVGAGSTLDLGTANVDLGCADLVAFGTVDAGASGTTGVRDVTIGAGGQLLGGSALLEVAGSWANAGSFAAGGSSVVLVDGCGLGSAVVTGSNTFATLELRTQVGKLVSLAAGAVQTVTGLFRIAGASLAKVDLGSTVPGSAALLDVQGTSVVTNASVEDNHAIGSTIPYGLNTLIGSNVLGWVLVPAVPGLAATGLAALAGVLGACAFWVRRRR